MSGYILTCFLCLLFVVVNGKALQVTYGDTWIYTDLAKRIFFTNSLRMDVVFDLVYPPLYPALISIAYFLKSQAAIFNAIMALNILVYSSAFFPIYFLFRDYARLTRIQAWCGAILWLISVWPLRYAVHIASEPLYYPLAAWFTWLLIDGAYLRGKTGLAVFISVFAALPLTKALGNIIFPAFILYSGIIYYFTERPRPLKLITRPLLVLVISVLIVQLYKKYQFSVLPPGIDVTGGYLSYLSYPNLMELSYWLERMRLNLSWLCRGTKTAALPMLIVLFIRNRKLVYKDPLVIFTAVIFAGTLFVIPVFTPADPLFREYPRYCIPFAFAFMVMLLKYHSLITRRDLFAAAGILSVGILIGLPPEFIREPVRWQIGAYYCLYFGCLLYWRKNFINVFLILMCAANMFFVWAGRTRPSEAAGSIESFYDQYGITEKILEFRKSYPAAAVLVDRTWRGQDLETWREYERTMMNMPFLPVFVEVDKRQAAATPSLLLTHQPVKGMKKMAEGKYTALYLLAR